jgi:RNA polymerase sigma-70 factor (ECF subfamily)
MTTAWSVIRRAGGDGSDAKLALGQLCESYWYPVYAFVRRQGLGAADAEDATQSFFARLLETDVMARADPDRGRFRGFLVAAIKQFLARRHAFESAAKRKPARPVVPLDGVVGEERYRLEPADHRTPERLFDHAWAMVVLDRALRRVRDQWVEAGNGDRFEALRPCLTGQPNESGAELARRLGVSEGAARVAIHRLKRQYGEALRVEIAQTIDADDDIDQELAHLVEALRC